MEGTADVAHLYGFLDHGSVVVAVAPRYCVHVCMASRTVPPGRENHFNEGDEEDGRQCNCAWHGRVIIGPERRQALVSKRNESGREKMNEGGGNQYSSAEMPS